MKFEADDEERPSAKLAGLDVAEIAAQLARVKPDGDAYDVLREVLSTLTAQAREPRDPTH